MDQVRCPRTKYLGKRTQLVADLRSRVSPGCLPRWKDFQLPWSLLPTRPASHQALLSSWMTSHKRTNCEMSMLLAGSRIRVPLGCAVQRQDTRGTSDNQVGIFSKGLIHGLGRISLLAQPLSTG